MHIYPCYRCPLQKGCTQREEFRKRARSVGATSIKFRCNKLLAEMRQGRRIVIDIPIMAENDAGTEYGGGWHYAGRYPVMAVITRVHGYKFACTVDKCQIDPEYCSTDNDSTLNRMRFRRFQKHYRIRAFSDEPDAAVCKSCTNVMLPGGMCDAMEGPFGCPEGLEIIKKTAEMFKD